MSRPQPAPIPAAPVKTLLEWMACDDGDTTGLARPACSAQAETLHVAIVAGAQRGEGGGVREPLHPPAGLRLAPLG
ncbi:hypothetical protein QLH51_05775 [Sphingomonas sp. 2R-10]|uniref:hypothetical protein n=1 Tax=Sphingomonas sp. 2R-10 TaxID=3045148 RepID=UPI0019CFA94E|nr:hypothetical protein [Sphingomonas sp. 2R-10]MDJ0276306.1 hypothetical protein [Sphingomonas sp. 2R-10]